MIISHKHKFIFVHPHRCGGTSVTRALLPYLGTKDEVYGCEKEYEILSEENRVKNIDCHGNEQGKNPWKHSTAKWIKEYTGKKIWDTYFKFVFVRNNPMNRRFIFLNIFKPLTLFFNTIFNIRKHISCYMWHSSPSKN